MGEVKDNMKPKMTISNKGDGDQSLYDKAKMKLKKWKTEKFEREGKEPEEVFVDHIELAYEVLTKTLIKIKEHDLASEEDKIIVNTTRLAKLTALTSLLELAMDIIATYDE